MRPLTYTQVTRCEAGRSNRCRCRCGGTLHGFRRSTLPEFFENLPTQDLHRMAKKSRQLRLPAPVGSEE